MKTAAEALTWVREQGISLEAAKVGAVPSLAHAIVQGPIKGSWWAHPKGKQIFQLASAVHDSGEVVVLKLIDGKNTYVHRALWPALLRVLLDDVWRAPRVAKLKAPGRQLYAEVERTGMVEHPEVKAVKEVETSLVALVASHHTDQGHHQKAVMSWARWAKQSGAKASGGALDGALAKLRAAAHGAEVL